MRSFDTITSLRASLRAWREDGKSVGFVPTMGALHDGHLSLIRRAKSECDVVVTSVFVNPTQFGPGEDFAKYPRDQAHDSRLAQTAGVDAIFMPPVEVMYPEGAQTFVDVTQVSQRWEGEKRPGHFRGAATVCTKLFNIVNPDRAYFGMKDYQQLKVIQRMVHDLMLPLTIVPCPIVREKDGLALSSRNVYLSPEDRHVATVLHHALDATVQAYRGGEHSTAALQGLLQSSISAEPRATIDYAVVVDADTLEPVPTADQPTVALVAVRFGSTRLIDNALLEEPVPRNGNMHQQA